MRKRIPVLIVCFTAVLILLCFSVSAEGNSWYDEPESSETASQQKFSDVQSGSWYYDNVMELTRAGVISGFPDGLFRPNSTVTTGQALKMIILAAGYSEPEQISSHWARGYLNFAIEAGFLERFEISDLDVFMSRGLTAKVAALALGLSRTSNEQLFIDSNDDYMHALSETGIIGGYPDGTCRPYGNLTRAELSAIVFRIYRYKEQISELNNKNQLSHREEIDLRTTEDGIDFIKSMEGFVDHAMWDYAQYSIGYGSRCDKDEYPDGITMDDADYLLRLNLRDFENDLNAFLISNGITVSPNQYDALVSFTYNNGSTWLNGSRLKTLLMKGHYSDNELASAMGIWCHVTVDGKTSIYNILVLRRIREAKIFLYGDYSGKQSFNFSAVEFRNDEGAVSADINLYKDGEPYGFLSTANGALPFKGWFTENGTQITEDMIASEDLILYAGWVDESGNNDSNGQSWYS